MDEAGGDGGDAGGGGGDDAAKAAAAEAARKAAADDAAKSGKSGPTDEEARLLKENMKRKEELKKASEEKLALEAKLKQFEGIDADAVRKLLKEKETAEAAQLEAKGDWERLKARMAEEHGKEVSTLQEQLKALQESVGKANSTINDLSIGSKFGQSQFVSEETTLTPSKARVIYGGHFELENGEVVGYDKPRGAQGRTAIVDQYGNAVAFDAALRKIVEADPEKDHLLKSKVKPGAGSDTKKQAGSGARQDSGAAPIAGLSKIAKGLASLNIPKN